MNQTAAPPSKSLNGTPKKSEVNGYAIELNEDGTTPQASSQKASDLITSQINHLTPEHLQEEEQLAVYMDGFDNAVDADFKVTQPILMESFQTLVQGMKLQLTEQAFESTSSGYGTVNIKLPGLPEGVNVTRTKDTFFVNDGSTLLERNEVRVKLGGLDAYSGYWLAVDAPANGIEDPLQEEGLGTLRRVMEAAGIPLTDEVYDDALEYPFLSSLLAAFGPEAMQPFEEHLRLLHSECSQSQGGCWFKMSTPRKARSRLEQVAEGDDETVEEPVDQEPVLQFDGRPRAHLSTAEEADLELAKLDL